jgi:thiol-disulfide isomerase/thioredoxin
MKRSVVIVVAIAIAAALGFFAQRSTERSAKAPTAPAAITPPATTTVTPATTTPPSGTTAAADAAAKVPETLPAISLLDRYGKQRALSDWAGRPVMVNYWATWCPPCRREIPLLNSLRAERSKQGLEIIGIAVDVRDDVLEYAKNTVIDYPLLIGEEDGMAAVTAMGMQPAFPFTVFADKQHRIVALKVGELHQDEADLILDQVLALDSATVTIESARTTISEGLKTLAMRRSAATG